MMEIGDELSSIAVDNLAYTYNDNSSLMDLITWPEL